MKRKSSIFAHNDGHAGGPATRGTPPQTLSAIIGDAFGSVAVTFSGDWVLQNTYDGFDRLITGEDAAGGTVQKAFDPGGRTIAAQVFGTVGGPAPTDRGGSGNVLLASSEARFEEAGRQYEAHRDVFLPGGGDGRAGGTSYVLARTVFDRADRTIAQADDNGAVTTVSLDGAGRQPLVVDALGNSLQRTFDGNGNVTFMTRIEKCTISGSIAAETFSPAFAIDVLNRTIIQMDHGPDASLNTNSVACCTWPVLPPTLFTFTGFDSNRTNLVDPKQNTTVWELDGASRQLREKRHLRPSGDGTTAISDTVLTQTALDANSNIIRLVDNNGGTSAWVFDLLDRNTAMQFHDGSTRTNVFNIGLAWLFRRPVISEIEPNMYSMAPALALGSGYGSVW
jgi:YD repeat-containing protein